MKKFPVFQEDEGSGRAVDVAFRTVPKDHTTFLVWKIAVSDLPGLSCYPTAAKTKEGYIR